CVAVTNVTKSGGVTRTSPQERGPRSAGVPPARFLSTHACLRPCVRLSARVRTRPKSFRSESIAPILNKAGQIKASPAVRLIFGQVAPKLDLSFTMNNRRILIANLAKGSIGEQAVQSLGLAFSAWLRRGSAGHHKIAAEP